MDDKDKLDENSFKETMDMIFTSLLDKAAEERAETEPYKELFEASTHGLRSFVRELERKATSVTLDASQVLESKGFEVTNEIWDFLTLIPFFSRRLERAIMDKEGFGCCVDKTYHIIYLRLLELLKTEDING
jgi:hypothetical protein